MTAPAENTPNGIITDAMQDAGKLQDGKYPSSEQLAKYSRRLRDVINVCQLEGLKLWLQSDTNVPLTQGKQKYTFVPAGDVNMTKPLRVLDGYYSDITSGATTPVTRPIFSISRQEWTMLSNRGTGAGAQGTITQYFVDKQATELDVSFWMTPDALSAANGSAHVLLQQQVTNFTGLTDTMNFPIEWRMYLRWALANDICTGQSAAIMQRCQQMYLYYKGILENWDVEDASTSFQPDMRQGQNQSAFR